MRSVLSRVFRYGVATVRVLVTRDLILAPWRGQGA
jgi:hypothetical protein